MAIRAAVPTVPAILAFVVAFVAPLANLNAQYYVSGSSGGMLLTAALPRYPANICATGFSANKVKLLAKGGFSFRQNGVASSGSHAYQAPIEAADQSAVTAQFGPILDAAYNIAPPFLQAALCLNVDRVYIDQDDQSPLGWSYWEEKTLGQVDPTGSPSSPWVGSGRGVFIAVNAKLLTQPPSLSELEDESIRSLLTTNFRKIISRITASGDAGVAGGLREAVLLVLAREMGFVTEHELAVQSGAPAVVACAGGVANSGSNPTFYDLSWSYNYSYPQPEFGKIHRLGDQTAGQTPKRPLTPVAQIEALTPATAITYLETNVYGTAAITAGFLPEWADLLAAQAPIEDFVETYELAVLSQATDPNNSGKPVVKSIKVFFTDGSASNDILNNMNIAGSILQAKMTCLNGNTSSGGNISGLIPQLSPLTK